MARCVLTLFLLLAPCLVTGSFFYRTMQKRKLSLLPDLPKEQLPADTWFQQRLDHFSPQDSRTWLQRYFVNDSFWDPENGPVFLFIEGEGAASPVWLVQGEMMTNARKYSALAVSLEHRFYGKSHPTPDLTTSSLRYLSSHQALADIARFHSYIVEHYTLTDKNRWIAFGGSYSGALAAWLRIKYPHIVAGAVATSAPVQAELDFYQYLEVVGQSLSQAMQGPACVASIEAALQNLTMMVQDRMNWPMVDKMFNIDPPLSSPEDISLLYVNLAGLFMGVVQYNNDTGKGNVNMNTLCGVMTNSTIGSPLQRLVALAQQFSSSMSCSIESYIESISDSKWDNSTGGYVGDRQWFYQTCTEFGYFQTTDGTDQPFGGFISLELYARTCELLFDIQPLTLMKDVDQTNYLYGGKNVGKSVTNIVFPNGSIDPWHALGVTSNITDSLVAIFITGTAHCANMYPESPQDPPQLVEARQQISALVHDWLTTGP